MFKCKTILILITGVLFFGIPVFPAVHYVSTNGTGTWAQSTNENTPCSMPVANTNASAGDTVYIKAGTYNNYIAPVHSGTSAANAITFRNYETDTVTISDASYGISLNGKSYIIVQGINFYNLDKFLWLQNSANHNTIAYCNFDNGRNVGWSGSKIYRNSSYNRVMHCRFSKYGYYTDDDIGCVLDVGNEESTTDLTGNNLLENCVFFHGGHHILGVYGMRNVIRNCYFHNEPWAMGTSASDRGAVLYGNRNISVSGYVENSGRNLFEGNSIAYSSDPSDNVGASGMSLTTSNNIVRMNKYYNNDCAGLSMTLTSSYLQNIRHNKIYNNSFFNNGHNPDAYIRAKTGIFFAIYSGPRVIEHNVIKNNILYKHRIPFDEYNINTSDRRGLITQQTFVNNWDGDTQGDPIFADATITPGDPVDSTWPDFNLESNSPCIDAGGSLTTITTASGFGMSFTVDDAGYFMDGWGIVDGDIIQLEGTTQRAQITNIDYGSNTITVNQSLTWTQGQGIALAFEGSSPDIGAYEYIPTTYTTPPARSNPNNFNLQQNYPNYGVFMADYAVQAVNAGSAAVLAWMLDDNSHLGFFWGLWTNKEKGMKLRPWFYPWSLLCRSFPPGSRIIRTNPISKDVRVLAAYCDHKDVSGIQSWSFCLVNRANRATTVRLHVPAGPHLSMRRYVYSKTSIKTDANGFPAPLDNRGYDLNKGADVPCEANSVVILTSIEAAHTAN